MTDKESEGYKERGALRSGKRFAALNKPYPSTEAELLRRHQKLLEPKAGPFTRRFRIGNNLGDITQTVIRYSPSFLNIATDLRNSFHVLFREAGGEDPRAGFEVSVTFNAILTNQDGTSFSVFYGQDYKPTSDHGVSERLKGTDNSVLVQYLRDIKNIPTSFDLQKVIESSRMAFLSSNVRIHKIINIVYLIYRFVQGKAGTRR